MGFYNPLLPETIHNPYPVYRRLRDEAPVYYSDDLDLFVLSRYDDVLGAFLDTATFISSEGVLMDGSDRGAGFLIQMDPPEHGWYRRIFSRLFTPKQVARLEPFVRSTAAAYLDRVRDESTFDVVDAFALRLPLEVICELLGIPVEHRDRVHELSSLTTLRNEDGSMPPEVMQARIETAMFYRAIVAERRKNPGDDLISMLTAAEVTDDDGRSWTMPDDQIAAQINMLAFAGHETVTGLVGSGTIGLSWYPAQRAELAADASLLRNAVEELLRWDNPAPIEGRTTSRDVELHGVTIPKGSRVLLNIGSANHDDRVFEEPELLDVHRRIDRPLGFGFGVHLCLGANLARLEARIAFEELLGRYPEYDVIEAGIVRGQSPTFRGLASVPIRVR